MILICLIFEIEPVGKVLMGILNNSNEVLLMTEVTQYFRQFSYSFFFKLKNIKIILFFKDTECLNKPTEKAVFCKVFVCFVYNLFVYVLTAYGCT